MNRQALMYHRGGDGIPKDIPAAESLDMRAIGHVHSFLENNLEGSTSESYTSGNTDMENINAMSNLAVLYGQRDDGGESSRNSVQLFRSAIDEFVLLETRWRRGRERSQRNKKHSPSMNNLAVVMESGCLAKTDEDKAKQLYLGAVETDENPIAMYNLGYDR